MDIWDRYGKDVETKFAMSMNTMHAGKILNCNRHGVLTVSTFHIEVSRASSLDGPIICFRPHKRVIYQSKIMTIFFRIYN